jgi:hypothetical protein
MVTIRIAMSMLSHPTRHCFPLNAGSAASPSASDWMHDLNEFTAHGLRGSPRTYDEVLLDEVEELHPRSGELR